MSETSADQHTAARRALAQSERRYRALVEGSLQGITIWSARGLLFANQRMAALLGRSVEELLAMSADEVRALVHPDGRAVVQRRIRERFERKPVPQRRADSHAGHGPARSCGTRPVPPSAPSRHGAASAVFEAELRRTDGRTVGVEFNNRETTAGGVRYMLTVARDMTERLKVQVAVRAGRRRLQELSRGLMGAQERERAPIAREHHDQVGQELTAIKLQLQPLAERPGTEGTARVADAIRMTEAVLEKVRTLSFDLRPSALDEIGLRAALRSYAGHQARLGRLTVRLRLGEPPRAIAKEVETACFRIAQEAITNVIRHARARRLVVSLRRIRRGIELVVHDDGIGVAEGSDDHDAGLGLVGMQERAHLVGGTGTVESPNGGGTRIRATFPTTGARAAAR